MHWETPHVSPIALTPSGNTLLAVNTPDNRLEVFDVTGVTPVHTRSIPVGLDPVSVLILPRVLALIVALPILAFLGSMAALYGGGLVAWLYGGMSPAIFIARLRDAVSVTHF